MTDRSYAYTGNVSFFLFGNRFHLYHDNFDIEMEEGFLCGKILDVRRVHGGTVLVAVCYWSPRESPDFPFDGYLPSKTRFRGVLSRRVLHSIR